LNRQAQQRKLAHELAQNEFETGPGVLYRCVDGISFSVCADDQIDGAMLEVPAARSQRAPNSAC